MATALAAGAAAGAVTAAAWPLVVLGAASLFALSHRSRRACDWYCR